MFYKVIVKYFDPTDNKEAKYGGFLEAENYIEAMEKCVNHYGENEMMSVKLTPFSAWSILDTTNMASFKSAISGFREEDLW